MTTMRVTIHLNEAERTLYRALQEKVEAAQRDFDLSAFGAASARGVRPTHVLGLDAHSDLVVEVDVPPATREASE